MNRISQVIYAFLFLTSSNFAIADYWVYQPDPGSDTVYTILIDDPFNGKDISNFTGVTDGGVNKGGTFYFEYIQNGIVRTVDRYFTVLWDHPYYRNYFVFENGELVDWAVSPWHVKHWHDQGFMVTKEWAGGTWVRKPGVAAIPEPSTYAMLGLGLGLLGVLVSRKKKVE